MSWLNDKEKLQNFARTFDPSIRLVSKNNLSRDLFFGVDYHSHLGTEVGGISYLDGELKQISHKINNRQFKSEFQRHYSAIRGSMGIGVISNEKAIQPIAFESKIGISPYAQVVFF